MAGYRQPILSYAVALLKYPLPVQELVLHLLGLGGGGERKLALPVPEGETAAVRCAGKEGGIEGAFHSLPVGGGEHGNNAMLGSRTGTRSQPKAFGKNKLFAPSLGRQEHLCWHSSLGCVGGKECIFGFLGVRAQNPNYLP